MGCTIPLTTMEQAEVWWWRLSSFCPHKEWAISHYFSIPLSQQVNRHLPHSFHSFSKPLVLYRVAGMLSGRETPWMHSRSITRLKCLWIMGETKAPWKNPLKLHRVGIWTRDILAVMLQFSPLSHHAVIHHILSKVIYCTLVGIVSLKWWGTKSLCPDLWRRTFWNLLHSGPELLNFLVDCSTVLAPIPETNVCQHLLALSSCWNWCLLP